MTAQEDEKKYDSLTDPVEPSSAYHFDETLGKCIWINDGIRYEWDAEKRSWFPVVDDYKKELQQSIYGPSKEEVLDIPKRKKRHLTKDDGDTTSSKETKQKKKPNCSIYVSNLPLDVTAEELEDVFSKYGVIAKDTITGKCRIKIYKDEDGQNKGDAIITYFREESVKLACDLCDGCQLRPGVEGSSEMSVQMAVFKDKKDYNEEERTRKLAEKLGMPDADAKTVKKALSKRREKLKSKVFDWNEGEPINKIAPRLERTVVLKHMFTIDDIKESPTLILDIKDDVNSEFEKLGTVERIVVYDVMYKKISIKLEPDGVISVQMGSALEAMACIQLMNGRFFAGREIEASIPGSRLKYKQSSAKRFESGEDQDTYESFGKWLNPKS